MSKADNNIDVTDVRIRRINSNNIVAVASVTLNNELIINDIIVNNNDGGYQIKMPNSEHAKSNNQFSIIPLSSLYKKIKSAIIENLN